MEVHFCGRLLSAASLRGSTRTSPRSRTASTAARRAGARRPLPFPSSSDSSQFPSTSASAPCDVRDAQLEQGVNLSCVCKVHAVRVSAPRFFLRSAAPKPWGSQGCVHTGGRVVERKLRAACRPRRVRLQERQPQVRLHAVLRHARPLLATRNKHSTRGGVHSSRPIGIL